MDLSRFLKAIRQRARFCPVLPFFCHKRRATYQIIVSLVPLLLIALFSFYLPVSPIILLIGVVCICLYLALLIRPPHISNDYPLVSLLNQATRDIADDEALEDYIFPVIHQTLPGETLWLWYYQPETYTLSLHRAEGLTKSPPLSLLPVDVDIDRLGKDWRLVSSLPECALRQGLLTLDIAIIVPLVVANDVAGLLGLGSRITVSRQIKRGYDLSRLNSVASQVAFVIQSLRQQAQLVETNGKLQQAYRRIIDTQEEERRRLATKLHDEILGQLALVGFTARKCQKQLTTQPDQVNQWLGCLATDTVQVSRRLREITQGLYPTVLMDLGLIPALRAYLDSLVIHPSVGPTRPTITLTVQGFYEQRLNNQKLACDIYYIVRQALDNALTHAQADQIFIHLRWRVGAISATVQDDGCGLREKPELLIGQNGHLGLLSMQERTLVWGGTLEVQTVLDKGTTIHAVLPVDQSSQRPTDLQAFVYDLSI